MKLAATWQITLIWIPMHPTLLPGVHFGIGRGAFNSRVGCKLLWGGVHLATRRGAFPEGGGASQNYLDYLAVQ